SDFALTSRGWRTSNASCCGCSDPSSLSAVPRSSILPRLLRPDGVSRYEHRMIEFSGVTRRFGHGPSRVEALRDVNLTIPAKQMCALMGPSGAGKSTLLHAAAGLAPIDSGRILIDNRDVSQLDQ